MTIIKQNSMTYKHKVIFYIRDRFRYEFWVGTYIPVTRPISVFWNRWQPKLMPKPKSKRGKPVKLSLVWTGSREYRFCCHAYFWFFY